MKPRRTRSKRGVRWCIPLGQIATRVIFLRPWIANAVITPNAFVQIAKIIKDGEFKPKVYTFNMLTDEAITLTYSPAWKDKIPENVQKAVEDAKAKILAGELKVPQIDFTEKEDDKD